ncbi:MAG: methyltransferase domain-containing protein [Verrucomicrobiae bacterium]|nr:methyltransferase domain-containing protein [Verrucomicrobiae bacterium]
MRIARFDRKARNYEAAAAIQKEAAAALAGWIPRHPHTGGLRAVEVGAGTGQLTAHLGDWPGTLRVTDVSPEMVAEGKRRFPRADWQVMHAADIDGAGPWDWIFSSSLLQWFPDPVEILRHWERSLAPGGHVLCGFFVRGTLAEFESVFGKPGPVRWFDPGQWRGFFESAGFEVLRAEVSPRQVPFDSARELMRTLHGTGAIEPRRTPPGEIRRLWRVYEERYPGPEGGVQAGFVSMRVLARRE